VARSAGGPPILRTPTATQVTALAYLTIAVTAMVFIAWYGAIERLGVDRAGLFNGLIPATSLAAVALTGTGTITPLRFLGALAVLAGVILGLGRARQVPASAANQAAHSPKASAWRSTATPGGTTSSSGSSARSCWSSVTECCAPTQRCAPSPAGARTASPPWALSPATRCW
jgi:hypothetical protein